ncbi:TNF receptor-associated factor 3-like [Pecten maximus]|uniref:TNF receptor-associated factor 3-like n=1 Tax=Pecten maximus TaxID=6579 RepID=UPI001458BB6E|nr:TNF receptor-associated factor 3-like [Pecten maximus]XP_033736035.1 TNF receptor-associated factor 3-like [Pecten maximus]XP_033736037.1 TNF receptor-associated factor 3-like [Pecten maximus]XP_033736038.1 TNF receptor-associated factor 3-like [Pecten maximus]
MSLETDGEDELASISPTFKSPLMNPVGKPQFISDPSEDNKCSICQSVLVNAFQLRCGHHICQDDIKFIFEQNDTGKCLEQDCGEIFSKEDVFPDACKRREISNLAVYCPNKDLGCEEKLPWSGLATHEAICSYQERHCDKCSQQVRLSELEDHTSNTCEYREIPCEYCRERISIKNIEHHKNSECQHSPLGCPNGCGVQGILREEVSTDRRWYSIW